MFAKSVEVFANYRGSRIQGNGSIAAPLKGAVANPERRARVRTTVHWPVLFFLNGCGEAIETVTQNLSSSGFYCHSRTLVAPGEYLLCAIKIPTFDPSGYERARVLECRVQVKRVEPGKSGDTFGVACQIHDYRLVVQEEDAGNNLEEAAQE